jgi:hypothetical protein
MLGDSTDSCDESVHGQGRTSVSTSKLRRALRQRRTVLYASIVGIAIVVGVAAPALAALPSQGKATSSPAIPATAIPALRTNMLKLARFNDDARPTAITTVLTTRAKGLQDATPGDLVPGSAGQKVYLVVIKGNFKDTHAAVPYGARIPTGKYLVVTIDPATLEVMDLGIGNNAPPVPLARYGPVSDLIKQG